MLHFLPLGLYTFAEKGLGISKTLGDLAGPMCFAVLMGASRVFYGRYGDGIDLDRRMAVVIFTEPETAEEETT